MSANPLDEYPKVRKILYDVQWVISGVMVLIATGYGVAGEVLPRWYGITAAVLSAFWAYTGITARGNTPIGGTPDNPDPPQPPLD